MPTTTLEACAVCGSAACLVFSPDFCRTTNQYRPEKAKSESEKVTPKQMPRRKGGKS